MSIDIVAVLTWGFITVGGALVAVSVWVGLGIFRRLDRLEALFAAETQQLRSMQHDINVRVTKIEERHILLDRSKHHADRT
jgi:hypothetical protein